MRVTGFQLKNISLIILLLSGFHLVLAGCSFEKNARIGAPYHHIEGGFRNPPDSPERESSLFTRLSFFSRMVLGLTDGVGAIILQEHVQDPGQAFKDFIAYGESDAITWIGHASFLVRLDGVVVLTDPIFSKRASPVNWAGPERLFPPGLQIEDLKDIDVLVISHAHYDHLDTQTLDRLPNRETITAVVPLGLGKYFVERNFGKVVEMDWYDEFELPSNTGNFRLTAYPAVHWSSRSLFDMNETLWMSFGFSAGGHSVFHSGDTETHPYVFKEIGKHMEKRHGGCSIGLMSIGAYAPRKMMKGAHMTPEGGVQVGRELGCQKLVPMHWGTFTLSLEPAEEPYARFKEAAGVSTLRMKIGETLGLHGLSSLHENKDLK